jgi:hypothetical protein
VAHEQAEKIQSCPVASVVVVLAEAFVVLAVTVVVFAATVVMLDETVVVLAAAVVVLAAAVAAVRPVPGWSSLGTCPLSCRALGQES